MNVDQTFSILFWLNKCKANRKGLAPIYVRITVDGRRAGFSTGKLIKPEDWNSDTGLPREDYYLYRSIKEYLRNVEVEITRHYNILLATTEYVSAEDVKRSYKGIKEKLKSILEAFNEFNKKIKELVEKDELKDSRYQHFLTIRTKCANFIKYRYKKSDILLRNVKLLFVEEFYHYLRTVQQVTKRGVEREIAHNRAMKICKDFKRVIDYAVIQEYIPSNPLRFFRCTYKKAKRTFLNQEELDLLWRKEIQVLRLEEVRDCYVFCCYTGYPYCDLEALGPDDVGKGIDGKLWLLRDRIKTDSQENVPLLDIPLEIIRKYKNHPYCIANNKLLPVNSNQRYNGYLKEIAAICGIKKKLTTHTARHTFATTVTLCNGVPIETVKELLGHADIRTTQIYAKIVGLKISNDMNKLKKILKKKKSGEARRKKTPTSRKLDVLPA